jgi:hypothetical protein
LGWVALSSKLERKRQSCFDNGAIVRFPYCDFSAMAHLLLKRAALSRPSGEWNDDDFDVLADGEVLERISR